MKSTTLGVEPIASLDSFAGNWIESAPLVGAVLAESLDLLALQTAYLLRQARELEGAEDVLPEVAQQLARTRKAQERTIRSLRSLAEQARTIPQRTVPESVLLRVRDALRELRTNEEVARELLLEGYGWRDLGVGD